MKKNCPLKNELLNAINHSAPGTHSGPGSHSAPGTHSIADTRSAIGGVVHCSSGVVCCAYLALKLVAESDEKLRRELQKVLK